MAKDKIEIISMGKSPVHEEMEWLAVYEFICKQVVSAFGVPPELLTPSNKGLQSPLKPAVGRTKPRRKGI